MLYMIYTTHRKKVQENLTFPKSTNFYFRHPQRFDHVNRLNGLPWASRRVGIEKAELRSSRPFTGLKPRR